MLLAALLALIPDLPDRLWHGPYPMVRFGVPLAFFDLVGCPVHQG
jgi:hypothetical protein